MTAAVGLGWTSPAAAESAAEVRDLARRAQSDPAALERLRQVRDVDGRPAGFERALRGAEGADLRQRLETIESGIGTEPSVPMLGDGAREQAARILATDRYQEDEDNTPRPLLGVIRKLGEWFEPILRPIGRLLEPIGRFLAPLFDSAAGLALLGAIVVGLAVLVASRLVARRNRLSAETAGEARYYTRVLDPRALDKEADAAEAARDYERAFRLRFLAGVLRLDKAGAIEFRQSATTGELVREVRSSTFPKLARAFDEIAYGGRPTGRSDIEQAKADWPRVLEEARR